MLKAYAAEFLRLSKMMAEIETMTEKAVAEDTLDQPITKAWVSKLKRWVPQMQKLTEEFSLPMVAAQGVRINQLLDDGDYDSATLITAIREVRARLEDELDSHQFVYVPPTRVSLYGARFGSNVDDKFPSAISDIESAGKCLALSLGTAGIFHLMRAMECAVQTLTAKLGFANTDRVWGHLLADMNKAVEAMPKGAKRDSWSECHSLLYHVKQAWRHNTMHPKETYTYEEAMDVYVAVRAFMSRLAEMI